MNFSERPPSTQWAALKYRGEKFAEVWFKPEGEPFALTFRIPQRSFQIPGLGTALRAEVLQRPDVHLEYSDEKHRIDMSKG